MTLRKRAAFWAILLAAVLLGAEALAAIALWAAPRLGWPARAEIRESLGAEASGAADSPRRAAGNVVHPYTGFVRNPAHDGELRINRLVVEDRVNEFGFLGPSPLEPGSDDPYRVVVTGGSVAEEFFVYARETLAAELRASGRMGDRPVEVVSAAVAGFKQPQQLFAISYLLALGARFDMVVNLDGFNEVVLPFTDNVPAGLAPSFPFRWNSVATDGLDPQTAVYIARVVETEDALRVWRRRLNRVGLRDSSLALAWWQRVKQRSDEQSAEAQRALQERLAAHDGAQMRGPKPRSDSGEVLFQDSVGLWARSSRSLYAICRSNGVGYLHLLQPNQYVAGSKPFEPAERKAALAPTSSPTRVGAELGYRLLIEEGALLAGDALPFVDLTDLFSGVREPIYRDACCHYFALGYETLAKRIAAEIALRTAPPGE
jgi:hypothetical protein